MRGIATSPSCPRWQVDTKASGRPALGACDSLATAAAAVAEADPAEAFHRALLALRHRRRGAARPGSQRRSYL